MPTQKIDPKVIFASDAPAIDKPPVFSDKTKGWDVARANDGRPEIKQMNKVQQDTDLKILWLNENAVLPYDASIDYPDGAVTIKDGSFKQLSSGAWVEFLDDFADKDAVKRGIANRYDSSLTYNSGERVALTNGDIVKSAVNGNTNDPNVNMTGWVYSSLTPSKNLSDVADEAEARTNLDVYSKAETDDIAGTPDATEIVAGKAKIATTAIARAGTNDTDIVTAKKLRDALNATGGAPTYALRAWGIIGGTLTPASLIKGGNVASIIDKGVGKYQVVFTTPLESADYAVLFGNIIYASNNIAPYGTIQTSTKTTTGFEIACGSSSYLDVTELYFGVIA